MHRETNKFKIEGQLNRTTILSLRMGVLRKSKLGCRPPFQCRPIDHDHDVHHSIVYDGNHDTNSRFYIGGPLLRLRLRKHCNINLYNWFPYKPNGWNPGAPTIFLYFVYQNFLVTQYVWLYICFSIYRNTWLADRNEILHWAAH